jgi:hypothetical protein
VTALVAVDPGKMTGLAFVETSDAIEPTVQQAPWEEAQDIIWTFVANHLGTVIVCERFTITMQTLKKAREYEALYVIGGLLLMTRRLPSTMVLQTPAEAKSFITDEKLRRLGWYERTKGLDHGRDALRHLALYAVTHDHLDPRRLI